VEVEPPTPSTDTGRFTDLQLQKKHTVLVPASRVSSRHSYSHSATETIREEDNSEDGNEEKGGEKQTYLRSKLWWLGLLLMAVGESANFISYGLAAASVVAPLGTVGEPLRIYSVITPTLTLDLITHTDQDSLSLFMCVRAAQP
jgi:hypothetical protein